MKRVIDIATTIALIALAVFVWIKWSPVSCSSPETITQTDTIYSRPDTVFIVKNPPPKVLTKIVKRVDTIVKYRDVDTAQILEDYFTKKYYTDVSTDDSTYWIQVNDTITENRIAYRDIEYKDLTPTKIINQTIKNNTGELYLGFDLMYGKDFQSAMPILSYKTKTDRIYGIGIDPVNGYFKASFKLKILER